MKKSALRFFILIGVGMIILYGGISWAQSSITVTLSFDKSYYAFGEPVGVSCVVSNTSGHDLWVPQGFMEKVCYMELRMIDPSGRLVIAHRYEDHDEFPDAPPLAFIDDPNNPGAALRAAPCEKIPAGWSKGVTTDRLQDNYLMKFPGPHSAQVQLSAMIFQDQIGVTGKCDVNNPNVLLNTFKSETKYITTEGNTQVHIVPNQWQLMWEQDQGRPEIQVQIKPEKGMTVGDYDTNFIRLNNKPAKRVEVLPSMVKAFFDSKEAIESLGQVEVGQWYPVVISGGLTKGGMFGGAQKVRIH